MKSLKTPRGGVLQPIKYKNVNWKVFEVKDLFEIFTGATIKKDLVDRGFLPRITATDLDNGVAMFTKKIENKNFKKYSNFISISFLGSVFYQKKEVSVDMKIHGIKIKNRELNEEIALFLIPLIKKFAFKFNYGYQLSMNILKKQKIILPVDENGNPNYKYMQDFIINIQKQNIEKTLDYIYNFNDYSDLQG